jgi:hypothetical protein
MEMIFLMWLMTNALSPAALANTTEVVCEKPAQVPPTKPIPRPVELYGIKPEELEIDFSQPWKYLYPRKKLKKWLISHQNAVEATKRRICIYRQGNRHL